MIEFLSTHVELLAGWLLGMVSTILSPYLTSIVDRCRFRAAVRAELAEIRLPLGSYVLLLATDSKRLNHDVLNWCRQEIEKAPPTDESKDSLEKIMRLLAVPADQLEAVINDIVGTDHKVKSIPKLNLWYLKSKPDLIALLSKAEQASVVKILSHLEVLNGKIDDLTFWDRRTFEANHEVNRQRMVQNSDSTVASLIVICKRLSRLIDTFV
jgi:hypothetical protein